MSTRLCLISKGITSFDLAATVTSPGGVTENAEIIEVEDGPYAVHFVPKEFGIHTVSVKYKEMLIPGITSFDLAATVTSPGGVTENAEIIEVEDGPYAVLFVPKELGIHTVSVKYKEWVIPGITSFDLAATVTSPGGVTENAEIIEVEDGPYAVHFVPKEFGIHTVSVKYKEMLIPGITSFDLAATVTSPGGVTENAEIIEVEDGPYAVHFLPKELGIHTVSVKYKEMLIPGITSFDLAATVTSPGGVTENAEIIEVEDGLYAVHFVPKEFGIHTVSVKYKEMLIPGSSFQLDVVPLKGAGAHLVHAGGSGLERGEQGQPCKFSVWTREAGAGLLFVSVNGPSKVKIDYKNHKDGAYVSYVVSEPGEYTVEIKFNDQHIPDSPYKLFISPALGDAHKLEVFQFPQSGVQPDKPAAFLVRKNGGKGELDAKLFLFQHSPNVFSVYAPDDSV